MQRSAFCRSRRELFLSISFQIDPNSNAYFLAKFGFDTASGAGRGARRRLAGGACDCSRPVSHPAPTQRGVVSHVCPHSRIAAVSLAEFVAVHIVLEKLPVAILNHQQFRVKYYYSQSSFRTPPVPSVFEDNPVYRRRRRGALPCN